MMVETPRVSGIKQKLSSNSTLVSTTGQTYELSFRAEANRW